MNRVVYILVLACLALPVLSCGGGSGVATGGGGGGGTGGGGGGSLGTGVPCGGAGTLCYSITVAGVDRTYALHVPANFQKNVSGLVVVLHGSDGSGVKVEANTQFSPLADQEGFAVVYPDGLTDGFGQTDWAYFFNDFTDDVGFLRQLIGAIQTNVGPDPKKIYMTGYSAGALMSHRFGVEASDVVAAIGSVEGTLYSTGTSQPVPSTLGPVSVIVLHGDQDNTIQYCGSNTDASQEQTFNYWTGASANSCSSVDTTAALCSSQGNITAVVEKDATGCSGNTEVQFYKLIGGIHVWPTTPMNVQGQAPYNPDFNATTGITATQIMWNFFAAHPKL